MAMYALKDTTLTALGDAVRSKSNETRIDPLIYNVNEVAKRNCESYDNFTKEFVVSSTTTTMPNKYNSVYCNFKAIEGAKAVRIKGHIKLIGGGSIGNSVSFNFLPFEWKFGQGAPDYTNAIIHNLSVIAYNNRESKDIDIILDNTNIATLIVNTDYDSTFTVGYYLEVIGLDENYKSLNNGEIIINTQEVVKNTMTPLEMVDTINGLYVPKVEPIVLSGQCQYACADKIASAYIELFGDTISTENIESSADMFNRFQGSSIPFEMNMKRNISHTMNRTFYNAFFLEELPKINNAKPSNISYLFCNCNRLRNIPEDWMDDWDFTSLNSSTAGQCQYMFNSCYSLRKIPTNVLKNLWSKNTGSYTLYSNSWYNCYTLDELVDIPIQQASLTKNRFTAMVDNCYRLKNLTFEVNEDGSPKTATWKSQTLDLSKVGYGGSASPFTNYNSGITADKQVKDDATYQALKDDPDWFSCDINYSRYNHTSAVNTINSLPDCSATGTNTIKFKGSSGALTDGGAINTLTEEEIAVATAKGWTVSLV